MNTFKPVALGIAIGFVWGGALFITTWLSYLTGYGKFFLIAIPQSLYPGYTISPSGSLLGLIYAFIDGFISGALIGWIYNKVVK
jgi:hypothetical protein